MIEVTRQRSLIPFLLKTLPDKMVFIGGPRQVGKTTLSLYLAEEHFKKSNAYLNWDIAKDRRILMAGELPSEVDLYILDEIHKYKKWRNLLKGFYDGARKTRSFLVTGSARLDYYRKGGDSLQGRFRYFRLHPYSVNELSITSHKELAILLKFGGFPEPLFKQNETEWRIWQRDRTERVIYDDIRDLESVKEISLLDELGQALPLRVGSILSIKSLREDLQVSHGAADRWVTILERLYYCYRVPPYGAPKIRAVKKEQKLYMWDWSVVDDSGARFENLVASQLLKYCHFVEDTQGHRMELRFLRDIDKREIDFVVLKDKKPLFAVECKTGEKKISPAIIYFKQRTKIPTFYQVHLGTRDFASQETGIRVLPFLTFCKELQMP